MSDFDDAEDADVPERAVAALDAASRRAIATGHTRVVVQDGQLVKIDGTGRVTVLKVMPSPKTFSASDPIKYKLRRSDG